MQTAVVPRDQTYLYLHHEKFIETLKTQVPEIKEAQYDPKLNEVSGRLASQDGQTCWNLSYPGDRLTTPHLLQSELNVDVAFIVFADKNKKGNLKLPFKFDLKRTNIDKVAITLPSLNDRCVKFRLNSTTNFEDHIYDFTTGKILAALMVKKVMAIIEEERKENTYRGARTKGFSNQDESVEEVPEFIQMPFLNLSVDESDSKGSL